MTAVTFVVAALTTALVLAVWSLVESLLCGTVRGAVGVVTFGLAGLAVGAIALAYLSASLP